MKIPDSLETQELAAHSEHLETILQWYLQEWPSAGNKSTIRRRLYGAGLSGQLPLTMLAVLDSMPVGFISLVRYEKGTDVGRPYWVDALYFIRIHSFGNAELPHSS